MEIIAQSKFGKQYLANLPQKQETRSVGTFVNQLNKSKVETPKLYERQVK